MPDAPQNRPSPVDVTVVVASRNRSDLVADALASIARQTLQNFEVVVVDDGSTAEHAEGYRTLVASLGPRFRVLQALQPGQMGSGPAV
ncbi:MAG: glycosyltransferase, partial [Acidobacteriota bacterium]